MKYIYSIRLSLYFIFIIILGFFISNYTIANITSPKTIHKKFSSPFSSKNTSSHMISFSNGLQGGIKVDKYTEIDIYSEQIGKIKYKPTEYYVMIREVHLNTIVDIIDINKGTILNTAYIPLYNTEVIGISFITEDQFFSYANHFNNKIHYIDQYDKIERLGFGKYLNNKLILFDQNTLCDNIPTQDCDAYFSLYIATSDGEKTFENLYFDTIDFNMFDQCSIFDKETQNYCYYQNGLGLDISLNNNLIKSNTSSFTNLTASPSSKSVFQYSMPKNTSGNLKFKLSFRNTRNARLIAGRYFLSVQVNSKAQNQPKLGYIIIDKSDTISDYIVTKNSIIKKDTGIEIKNLINMNGETKIKTNKEGYLYYYLIEDGNNLDEAQYQVISVLGKQSNGGYIFFHKLFKTIVEDKLLKSYRKIYQALYQKIINDSVISLMINLGLILYTSLIIYRFFFINTLHQKDLLIAILKIILISMVTNSRTGWEFFDTNITQNILIILDSLINNIFNTQDGVFGLAAEYCNQAISLMTYLVNVIVVLIIYQIKIFALGSFSVISVKLAKFMVTFFKLINFEKILMIKVIIIILISAIWVFCKNVLLPILEYVKAILLLHILLSLFPLLLIFILFENTKSIVISLINNIISIILSPVILLWILFTLQSLYLFFIEEYISGVNIAIGSFLDLLKIIFSLNIIPNIKINIGLLIIVTTLMFLMNNIRQYSERLTANLLYN